MPRAAPPGVDVREVTGDAAVAISLRGALWRAYRRPARFRPDIVLAGSGLVAPFAWAAARLASARMVVYVHGLDLIVPNRVYRWFWLPFIRRADLCIANSQHTARLAAAVGVPASRTIVIHPGVDLPRGAPAVAADFRARFGLGERPLLLSVGRLIARKGLLEFVENALPEIVREHPDVCLVVLGDETPALLHGSSVGSRPSNPRERPRNLASKRTCCSSARRTTRHWLLHTPLRCARFSGARGPGRCRRIRNGSGRGGRAWFADSGVRGWRRARRG